MMSAKCNFSVLFALAISAAAAAEIELEPFGRVKVLDVVDCTKKDHRFVERPAGVSRVETILGRRCRTIEVQPGEVSSMFAYRLGEGKGLKANGAYVIVLEYPDDVPRNYVIHNRATDSRRGFSTGRCMGDAWEPKHVDNHPESLDIPQSGRWQRWVSYNSLTDHTPDFASSSVDKKPVWNSPPDGFDFVVSQYSRRHNPASHGIAVARILLCELPDEKRCYAEIRYPEGLPRRHIFWREEMSDNGAINAERGKRHCDDQLDWIRHKCRQMKILGMNTYMKDLLEFGHVQHWDPNVIRMNWAWSSSAESNALWGRIVEMVSREYGFSLMPYYEWYGNFGQDYGGKKAYGYRKLAEPLGNEKNYTHVWWTEKGNLDITDPEALAATKNLLRGSILRFKDKADFAGAFFRTRPASWPVGFGEGTRSRFAKEVNSSRPVTKEQLRADKALYNSYLDWWHRKRRDFLGALGKFLADEGLKNAQVLFDGEGSEPGPGFAGRWAFSTDSPDFWKKTFAAAGIKEPHIRTIDELVSSHAYLQGRNEPCGTWGKWEWQHAAPADRPGESAKDALSAFCMPVNRMYSVGDSDAFAAYADARGMTTIVRHHSLNEHMQNYVHDGKEVPLVGYEMNDSERAGRASMMIEIEAMAKGDIANIGYLIGSTFSRGFPGPVREFNMNFLALPALPSKLLTGAASDSETFVREIATPGRGQGKYYAIVHTGKVAKKNVKIRFPKGSAAVKFIVADKTSKLENGILTIKTLKPWQLIAIHRK